MNKIEVFVGVDISKKTLDIILGSSGNYHDHRIDNTIGSIRRFFRKHLNEGHFIIGMENTGRYNWPLLAVLSDHCFEVYVVNPLHINKSLGLVRGKDDRTDARRICDFIRKNHAELTLWEPKRKVIEELGVLISERKRLKKMKTQTLCAQKDLMMMENGSTKKTLIKNNRILTKNINDRINVLETALDDLVKQDESLNQQSRLLQTVTGIGKVLCWNLLYKTNEFRSISDPRKMACYAGVVPFEHSSGTSIRGRSRVSGYADRDLKGILHMAAMSSIRLDGELRTYYLRKVAEGKNKMSVLNAVRNKIIHRAFAVIKHGRVYQDPIATT